MFKIVASSTERFVTAWRFSDGRSERRAIVRPEVKSDYFDVGTITSGKCKKKKKKFTLKTSFFYLADGQTRNSVGC